MLGACPAAVVTSDVSKVVMIGGERVFERVEV